MWWWTLLKFNCYVSGLRLWTICCLSNRRIYVEQEKVFVPSPLETKKRGDQDRGWKKRKGKRKKEGHQQLNGVLLPKWWSLILIKGCDGNQRDGSAGEGVAIRSTTWVWSLDSHGRTRDPTSKIVLWPPRVCHSAHTLVQVHRQHNK